MPNYHFLLDKKTDFKGLPKKIAVQRKVGVPYEAMTADVIQDKARKQGLEIATGLIQNAKVSVPGMEDLPPNDQIRKLSETQLIALIAYVQKLGAYDEVEEKEHTKHLLNNPDNLHD